MKHRRIYFKAAGMVLAALFLTAVANGQTSTFSFASEIPKGGLPATDSYDMEFKLMDAATGGTQVGGTIAAPAVAVKNREYTVWLDFGASVFTGADRYIEVSLRRANTLDPFVVIEPRTPILSVPYAIRSLTSATADNALNLGGVDAGQFVQTTDPRLTDARDPNPGSNNYIQNTTAVQSPANFNISGNGTAGGTLSGSIVNSTAQFNIGGVRALSLAGIGNVFVGPGTGQSNTTGSENSFLGRNAGLGNTSGAANSFFGRSAGANNSTGSENSFFGRDAGTNNTTANDNAFFGSLAGRSNTTGAGNAFFGRLAGESNTAGANNSFVGFGAGENNTTGISNAFLGRGAGSLNTAGSGNSMVGDSAGFNASTGTFNAFFGAQAGSLNTSGNNNTFIGTFAGNSNATGSNNTALGVNADVGSGALTFATAIGSNAVVTTSNTVQIGRTSGADTVLVPGLIQVNALAAAGTTTLCRNASNQIAECSTNRPNNAETLSDAVRVQQLRIERQERRIESQERLINALKSALCAAQPTAAICGEGTR